MNVVAIKTDGKIFQSQSYDNETQRQTIEQSFINDAQSAGVEIVVEIMTNEQLMGLISQ